MNPGEDLDTREFKVNIIWQKKKKEEKYKNSLSQF